MIEKKGSSGALLTDLQRGRIDAQEVASEIGVALTECSRIAGELEDAAESDEREHGERLKAMTSEHVDAIGRAKREHAEEFSRLRSDMMSKDAKIKEIQSKFSFVIGTVTERNEELIDR